MNERKRKAPNEIMRSLRMCTVGGDCKACACYGVPLTLMHYDRSADVYVAQELCTGGEMQEAGIDGAD